jgi:hypothetical protein
MARNGSGTYSLPQAAFVSGSTIESAKVNSNFSDIGSEITASLAKDGQTVPTANLPMGTFKHTNVGAASARTDYARASQIADNSMGYAASSGTDTITAAPSPGITAYAIGQRFTLKKDSNANTGAVTLNINSVGAGSVTWPDGSALAAADLPANCAFEVVVQATTPVFHLVGPGNFTGTGKIVKAISPAFTGSPTAPTQSASDNSTKIATTAYVDAALGGSPSASGRLTLTSATPVLTASVTGAGTVYFTPYKGNRIPLYGGSTFSQTVFTELSNVLANSATGKAGPAAAGNNQNLDLFVWSDSGTIRLTRGPAWSSDTARGSGAGTTELDFVLGVYVNKVAITNGPSAGYGTYVGTIRTDGSAQANWQPGGAASGGTAALLNVWNAYNRVDVTAAVYDSTASWNYTTATWRSADNSAGNRVSWVQGLQEDPVSAEYICTFYNITAAVTALTGVNLDSTSATPGGTIGYAFSGAGGDVKEPIARNATQSLGFHYFQAMEISTASGTSTWYGKGAGLDANAQLSGLYARGRF